MKRVAKITTGGVSRAVNFGAFGLPPYALANITRPSVTGSLYANQEVAANTGTWSAAPESFTYEWLRAGVVIPGATGPSYVLTDADVGVSTIRVRVTASRSGYYSSTATSSAVTINASVTVVDLDDLTGPEDTPVITYQSLGSTAPPSFASAGWIREKRIGVAEVAPGGTQTSTADLDVDNSTRFRYPGILAAVNWTGGSTAGRYAESSLKTGGGVQSARWLFPLEFIIDNTDRVQIAMNAVVANPRLGTLVVNGRRVSATDLIATGTAGSGFAVTLVFPSVGRRRIKIYGLNHNQGRFGGVAVPTGGTVVKPSEPITRMVAVLGDSLVNGSTGVSSLQTFVWDVARALGADAIVQMGVGGTGFTNNGGDPDGLYINRVPDVMALKPNVLLVVGGRNDGNTTGLSAAVTAVLDGTDAIPERYLLSENVSAAGNTVMKNAAQASGVAFIDLSDYGSLVPLSDGVHPTLAGHRQLAAITIERMNLNANPDPGTLTPATGTPSTGLPWELPSAAQISSGPNPDRKQLVHYYAPEPGAFSNAAADSYETAYLAVQGENGKHAAYGGYVRDRPLLGAPFATTPVSWQRNMQAAEIRAMKEAGVDGAFCNILGSSGDNWNRYMWLLDEAAANFPGFKVVPMVDANGGMAQNDTTAVAAARINTFLSSSAAWVLSDGRYVVATFKMEGRPLTYWTDVKAILQSTYGKNTAWIGVYNNIDQAVNYDSVQWATGRWEPGADPNIFNNLDNNGPAIKGRGKKFLVPVEAQNVRYRAGLFDESRNTEAIRAAGDALIRQDADLSQVVTWSDHSEATQLRPTVARKSTFLDVNTYRLTKWKTGKFPQILRDGVYLTYRNQMLDATITSGQTLMLSRWVRGNRSDIRERVEVLTYLTAPATVTVKIGASTYSYAAPSGEFSFNEAMEPGEVSVKVVRATTEIARINSPVVIRSTAVNQDRQYFGFSSIRGTAGQYDPTPGAPTANAANYIV